MLAVLSLIAEVEGVEGSPPRIAFGFARIGGQAGRERLGCGTSAVFGTQWCERQADEGGVAKNRLDGDLVVFEEPMIFFGRVDRRDLVEVGDGHAIELFDA